MNTLIESFGKVLALKPLLVDYHLSRLISALNAMRRWGTETSMPVGCSRTFQRHKQAVRRLGFLVEREFALQRRPISGADCYRSFRRLLRAGFPDGLWACDARGTRVVVTLLQSQMREWEQFFVEYDQGAEPLRGVGG